MSVTIDASRFNAMLRELSRKTGVGLEEVIRAETAAVLQKAMSNTKAAEAGKIRARFDRKKISKEDMMEKLRRRGLAKQSWVALAQQLGLPIKAPTYVTKAQVNKSSYPQKVQSSQTGKRGTFVIQITNSMISMIAANGKGALAKAINGRTSYFKTGVKKGVFNDWKTIAAKYPGLKVSGL